MGMCDIVENFDSSDFSGMPAMPEMNDSEIINPDDPRTSSTEDLLSDEFDDEFEDEDEEEEDDEY